MKATSCIVGPNDTVLKPRGSTKMDWEVELGVVIGSVTRYVGEADAPRQSPATASSTISPSANIQLERGGQWDKGKGCDTFGPSAVSGHRRRSRRSRESVHVARRQRQAPSERLDAHHDLQACLPGELPEPVHDLHPGDIITTGTPPGVGMGIKPNPIFLNVGDVMELGIEKLGSQRQVVAAA